MSITFDNIAQALNELIVHEEGLRFQRLAISLAKKRWPELIATEVKKDGGEDALKHPYLTKDGKRFDIASSITATYGKVREDLEKICDPGVKLDLLIFYTPRKVFNRTAGDWKRKIKAEFGCGLLIISREDIILELLKPENRWMCATFLRMEVPSSPDVKDATDKATHAVSKILEQWRTRFQFSPDCLIDIDAIKLDENRRPTGEIFKHHDICAHLAQGGRTVLSGAPGAGKTTTLIQISEHLLSDDQQRVPLLISLPEWIESGEDILAFATKHPDFIAANVSPTDLALIHQGARLVFVFNGWNEIPLYLLAKAGRQLNRLDREFPAAGVIVATREHDLRPPLIGTLYLRLIPLTDSQRRAFVNIAISDEAEELLSRIESDSVLSEITRTPLVLSEVVNTYESGVQVPRTKSGVLRCVIKRTEECVEHSAPLQSEPIWGRSGKYLSEIATDMTQKGRTALQEGKAQAIITKVNEQLQREGQLAALPDPKSIVDTLCAHHMLEKSSYPVPSVHFMHQQFQELYSATKLKEMIADLLKLQRNDAINQFQAEIINMPAWGEPLKLLAEEIGEQVCKNDNASFAEDNTLELGVRLVEWSIPVDPIFAAELGRLCGPPVWDAVKASFESLLRKWYKSPYEDHKACSLAAMFATGTDDFADIIWPLLEHTDQQVRLKSYRVPETFFLSCLGQDWRSRVCSWKEEHRAEFVKELSFKGGPDTLAVVEDFAINDPSVKVRVAATNALRWQGAINKFFQVLSCCDPETLQDIIKRNPLPEKIPDNLIPRIEAAYKKLLTQSETVSERLILLRRMYEVHVSKTLNLLKAELANYAFEGPQDHQRTLLADVLQKIASEDPDWASEWVARRQAEGKLRGEYWADFLRTIPKKLMSEAIERFLDPHSSDDNARKVIGLIVKGATKKDVRAILQKLVDLQRHINTTKGQLSDAQRNLYWRLKDATREVPWPILIDVVLEDHGSPRDISELKLILELLNRTALEADDARQSLTTHALGRLRSMLQDYSDRVFAHDDYSGTLKAYLSSALAKFGKTKDLDLIQKLVRSDVERRRRGAKAFEGGERHSPQVDGFRMDYSGWHVRALCQLDPENADRILLDLLEEPYYEEEAARGLAQLLRRDMPDETKLGGHPDYKRIFEEREKRSGFLGDGKRRKRYATAIMARISTLEQERERTDKIDNLNHRLKRLSAILATISEPSVAPLILKIMALPGKWDGWTRVAALEALARNGVELDMNAVELVLDPTIVQLIKDGIYRNQNADLLKRSLCVFAVANDPIRAVRRIGELARKHLPVHEMRDVVVALGYSQSLEATKYLIDLAQDRLMYKKLGYKLFESIAYSHLPEAAQALLSTIDPKIAQPKMEIPTDYFARETLSQAIADLCRQHKEIETTVFELCNERLADSQREIIANVIEKLSTSDAIIAGLKLISDKSKNPKSYPLRRAIEHLLVKQVPVPWHMGAYELEPQEDKEIRYRLFDMAIDDRRRCRTAFELLGFIHKLRFEYGKPPTEPRHPNLQRGKPWPLLELIE